MSNAESRDDGLAYRWTCPLCNESNVGFGAVKDPLTSGIEALESHVRSQDDDLHGPEYKMSARIDRADLRNHVEAVDLTLP